MKILLWSVFGWLALAAGAAAADGTAQTISVDGRGLATARPDRARVVMAVQSRGQELAAARESVIDVTRAFFDVCEALDIDGRQIQATGLTLRPQYRYRKSAAGQEQVFDGYLVSRQLQVELTDLERLGPLLERSLDAGVNEVYPPQLYSSRQAGLRREALKAAALDARANAGAVAAGLRLVVGNVVEVRSTGVSRPERPQFRAARVEALADDAAETYRVGEIRIEAGVVATFEFSAPPQSE